MISSKVIGSQAKIMKAENQWLFELPLSADNEGNGFFAKARAIVAPYVMPAMMAISGLQVVEQSTQQQQKPDVTVVDRPPLQKNPDAIEAFKAAAQATFTQRGPQKKPKKTGGTPPSPPVRIKLPTFTGYPISPSLRQPPVVNRAGFRTREAEFYPAQEAMNQQAQWLFELPLEADYHHRRGQGNPCKTAAKILRPGQMDNLRQLANNKAKRLSHNPKGGGNSSGGKHDKGIARKAADLLKSACGMVVNQGYEAAVQFLKK